MVVPNIDAFGDLYHFPSPLLEAAANALRIFSGVWLRLVKCCFSTHMLDSQRVCFYLFCLCIMYIYIYTNYIYIYCQTLPKG